MLCSKNMFKMFQGDCCFMRPLNIIQILILCTNNFSDRPVLYKALEYYMPICYVLKIFCSKIFQKDW
jgi:hypothetical protein